MNKVDINVYMLHNITQYHCFNYLVTITLHLKTTIQIWEIYNQKKRSTINNVISVCSAGRLVCVAFSHSTKRGKQLASAKTGKHTPSNVSLGINQATNPSKSEQGLSENQCAITGPAIIGQ